MSPGGQGDVLNVCPTQSLGDCRQRLCELRSTIIGLEEEVAPQVGPRAWIRCPEVGLVWKRRQMAGSRSCGWFVAASTTARSSRESSP